MCPGFACKDHDLTHDIGPAQVKPWIRFCIAFVLRLFYHIGKFAASVIIIKNKIKRTA